MDEHDIVRVIDGLKKKTWELFFTAIKVFDE